MGSDLRTCIAAPLDQLHAEGTGSALRAMFENPGDLIELMVESGMIEDAGPFHKAEIESGLDYWTFFSKKDKWERERKGASGQWVPPHLDKITECCMEPEIVAELEWMECCEPSYFKVYDMSTGESHKITGPRGGDPVLHDAKRHEQQCNLNNLVNPGHPLSTDRSEGTVRSEDWEKDWVFTVAFVLDLELVATGKDYAVGLGRYGAVWIPKSCIPFLPPIGESFTAHTQVSRIGKYPLRVMGATGSIVRH
jgi:hypothetical protein